MLLLRPVPFLSQSLHIRKILFKTRNIVFVKTKGPKKKKKTNKQTKKPNKQKTTTTKTRITSLDIIIQVFN